VVADERLAALLRDYPLSDRWLHPSLYVDTVRIGSVAINLCGLVAGKDEATLTGSAAEVGGDPLTRAFFELVERTSVLDFVADARGPLDVFDGLGRVLDKRHVPELFPDDAGAGQRYSKSNGVAAGRTWDEACTAARAELVERDRVLRSWYGEIDPVRSTLPDHSHIEALRSEYEWSAYVFPTRDPSAQLAVAGVFAFPRAATAPLAFGFGASANVVDARDKAGKECVQRLGFLWGEDLPGSEPPFEPSAEYHQEFYLRPSMHERVRSWLEGVHGQTPCKLDRFGFQATQPEFVDITPGQLRGRLFVVRALASSELQLVFGRGHPRVVGPVSERFLIHPLP